MNCILINILREFGMYAIKKDIKKQSFTKLDELISFFLPKYKIQVIIINNSKFEINKALLRLVQIHYINDFDSIGLLKFPNNSFIWIIDKNTKVHPKEFLNAVVNIDTNYDFMYFDEEFKFNDNIYPFLKPCWSPIYFTYNNIGNALWINSEIIRVNKFKSLNEIKRNIAKISKNVLYVPEIILRSDVSSIEIDNNYLTKDYVVDQNELVSIVILTKDKANYLKRLINSIETKTFYNNREIIIVDHESNERETLSLFEELNKNYKIKIIKYIGEFNFSKMNNIAVKETKGSHLIFLNNDIEILEGNWINRMLFYSQNNYIGVVGTKLLYPDGTLQHCGISVGIYSTTGHFQRGISKDDPGYMNTCKYPREVLAVTGACIMISKEKFVSLGMFNEDFKVIFNDVDLSLKAHERNLTNIVIGNLSSIHYEGITRGVDKVLDENQKKAISLFWNKWGKYVRKDPYFNAFFKRNSESLQL